jgi:hypothetical protein
VSLITTGRNIACGLEAAASPPAADDSVVQSDDGPLALSRHLAAIANLPPLTRLRPDRRRSPVFTSWALNSLISAASCPLIGSAIGNLAVRL